MNYGGYVKKTASCPIFGDWAIANKLTVKWGNARRGDIVLFDFNHNGTSDHIGIVTKVTADYIETIEGNTGSGSNTNGDGVYRRKRYKSQVNYFVRTKCPNIEAVIKTAESQLGYKEGRNNSNKYGKWFGYNNVSWCCEFVVWCFYHTTEQNAIKPIPKPTGKYTGTIPSGLLKRGSKGEKVKQLQKFLNWYYKFNLTVDGDFGDATEYAVMRFQRAEGITVDGNYGKCSYAKAKAYKSTPPTPQNPSSPPEQTPSRYTGEFPDFTLLSGNIIAKTAKDLSWAKGTSSAKYKYPNGSAKSAFTKAIDKVYPKRSSWSKQCRMGASCDVGAGTIIRYSGIDKDIPRGLDGQIPHLKKSAKWSKVDGTSNAKMIAGDIGVYSGNGGHIWISLGGKTTAEANHTGKCYEHIVDKSIGKGTHTYYAIFRANVPIRNVMKLGDEGSEVTKWQKFLKWYGFDCAVDGAFGEKTLGFTKTFQYDNGLDADGEVGSKTLAKAKEYTK